MSKQRIVIVALLLLAVVAIVVAFLLRGPGLTEFKANNITFQYPANYQKQSWPAPVTNQAQTLLKLKSDNPLSFIEFAQEQGAIIGANVTKTDFLGFLEKTAQKSLPSIYKDYKDASTNRIKISGHDASMVTFNYQSNDEKTRLYVSFFIITNGNDGYYLTIQSVDQAKLKADTETIQKNFKIT